MDKETLIHLEANSTAIVVGVCREQNEKHIQEDLDELEALLRTLAIPTAARLIQKRAKLSASHLLGSGKVEEIKKIASERKSSLVVIDHPLTGPQVRNLESETNCQVIDRAAVILDIFAKHAKTNQAKTQVKIAQLEYLLPKLTGAWTHFQRQSGGGVSRGMGEKQIEIDRRRARERISRLEKKLEHISIERETQRKQRRSELCVSLVGYTNSGKTSLMRALTAAQTEGKDELFATLDTHTKSIDPSTRPKILLSDTVGFIRSLPHSLIESFKSTLDEVTGADLLLHVVDVSHPNYQLQMETTDQVLKEIGAGEIPMIRVFNKIDKLVNEVFLPKILVRKYHQSVCLSAFNAADILRLRNHIYQYFQTQFLQAELRVAAHDQAALSLVYSSCVVLSADYEREGEVGFVIRAPAHTIAKLRKLILWLDEKNAENML